MEAQEEVIMGSKELANIVKGKRTKRQRPQSPIPFAITTNSSSGDGGNDNNTNTILSPTTSTEFGDSTEEEEDMANCLILLAQGQSPGIPKQIEDNNVGIYKFNSRRYLESAAATNTGKAGYCVVYECKTCNRTFPSFQALGGHRASHKKLKTMAALSDDEEAQLIKNSISPLTLQLGNNRGNLHSSNKSKVHECSICGAEFTSGQALGGHMRRHRGPISTNTNLSLSPIITEETKKPRNVLSLDLNLPAPEDDHRESKFPFASKQQQQQQQQQQSSLVFSAPTLVDCHY